MEEKFKDLYNQLIDENEEALKSAQQKLKSTSKRNTRPAITFTISGVFALMCFIIAENAQKIYIKVLFIIVGLLAILLCFNIFKKIKKRNEKDDDLYNAIYQNKIIKSLMQLFYDEPYVCMPKIGITHDVFNKIQFKNFDSYVFSNLLVGTMNKNCSFKISNVYATEYRAGTSNSNNEKVIFSGIVVEIELPKSLDYYLYITKKENILLSGLDIAFKKLKLKKYKIKTVNIDDKYDIYSSDEAFTNNILSDDVLQKLLEYNKSISSSKYCEITIRNNYIYLMLPGAKVPGTDVILYENRESMFKELWEEFKKLNYAFELSNLIISKFIP